MPDPARRRAVVLTLIAAGLLAILAVGPVHEQLTRWMASAGALLGRHPVLGALLFVLLAAAAAMMAFLSSGVLLPAALSVWSEPVCVALLWTGWIAFRAVRRHPERQEAVERTRRTAPWIRGS